MSWTLGGPSLTGAETRLSALENGFRIRFDMPYDQVYRTGESGLGYSYWETWKLGSSRVPARVWPGESGTSTDKIMMTAVPEPATSR